MAKLKLNNAAGRQKSSQNATSQGTGDRIISLFRSGMQDIDTLASAFEKVNSALNSRKTTDTDIAVKLRNAETASKKEDNRHSEEMAKIEREWKKLSDETADRERRLTFIQEQIQKFQAEYDKYMAMETDDFLSATVTSRLESLRKVIMELTKELNRAK